ncbi:hypothetical protein CLOSTMETH_03258 [[Clostridium] methylpentosum DSM 5476]|uniref:Uncharacterized protein n=1 Tax=[Clostridium] methylpentosum DSM 5476 TaxID=537013 RepID=C0EH57_9FIRM|nr:hypothetical protein CLOSTMETH_03258 [[Clostridium] methylpentosum DSM 5476]
MTRFIAETSFFLPLYFTKFFCTSVSEIFAKRKSLLILRRSCPVDFVQFSHPFQNQGRTWRKMGDNVCAADFVPCFLDFTL